LKPVLTEPQYAVVLALVKDRGRGLSGDQLDREAGRSDARKYLYELSKDGPDWKAVIHRPERKGRGSEGYRIG
jgi:hypothetical protein